MMATQVSEDTKKVVEQQGYAISGNIGGQPKRHYWTPDGREIWVMASMREYARKDDKGKVIEQGVRDANIDRGWLLEKPKELKLFCQYCDLWHDTQVQINECGKKRQLLDSKWQKKAKTMLHKQTGDVDTSRLETLESQMDELKSMLKQLLERK